MNFIWMVKHKNNFLKRSHNIKSNSRLLEESFLNLFLSCVIVAVSVALWASWLCWPPLPINLASLLSLSFPNRIQESSQALYSVFCHLLIYDHRGTAAQGEGGGLRTQGSYHRPFDNQVICVRWPGPLSDFLGRTPHPRQKIMFNNAASAKQKQHSFRMSFRIRGIWNESISRYPCFMS